MFTFGNWRVLTQNICRHFALHGFFAERTLIYTYWRSKNLKAKCERKKFQTSQITMTYFVTHAKTQQLNICREYVKILNANRCNLNTQGQKHCPLCKAIFYKRPASVFCAKKEHSYSMLNNLHIPQSSSPQHLLKWYDNIHIDIKAS